MDFSAKPNNNVQFEQRTKRANTMQIVGLVLWFLVLVLFGYFVYRLAFAPRYRHVSVTGQGEAKAAPNVARITVGVQTETSSDVSSAADTNARTLEQVLTAVENTVGGAEVETLAYEVYPVRDRDNNVTQYRVSNRAKVTLRGAEQVSRASALLGAVSSAGANQIDGLDFDVDDETREQLEAMAEQSAVQNAYTKAQNLAESSGSAVGVAVSIDEPGTSFGPTSQSLRAVGFEANDITPPPIRTPEEITVTRRIEVTYQLK